MSLTFGGMLIGLLIDVLLAARLGASQAMDSLIIALSLPLLIDTVTREGSKFSMVPLFVEKRRNEPEDFDRFTSAVLNSALLIGLALYLISVALSPFVVNALGPGLTAGGRQYANDLFLACAPVLALAPAITVMSVLLNSSKRFYLAALRNSVAPSIVLVSLCISWNQPNVTIWVAGAYSVGFTLYFVILAVGLRLGGRQHSWGAWINKNDYERLSGVVFWPTLGFSAAQGVWLAERAIASLVTIGGVSSYYFAFRIYSGIQSVVGTSIATTGLPGLTEDHTSGQVALFTAQLRRRAIHAFLLALPISIFIIVFRHEIVDFVYARGVFDDYASERTAELFGWFGVGILFATVLPVLNSGLYAIGAIRTVFGNMLVTALCRICLAWWFASILGFGLQGIAAAVAITVAFSLFSLICLLRWHDIKLLRA